MQEKLFQRCTHFLYSSVLSLGGKVNTYKTDVIAWHGIHFHKNNLWNILVIGNYYVNFQNYQNWMLLTSSDTKRTLMHLFLFTNSGERELVSICTQSIRNCNTLSLHYNLVQDVITKWKGGRPGWGSYISVHEVQSSK